MVYYIQHYVIDWNKVRTLDDIKKILMAINIAFEPDFNGLSEIGEFVRLEAKPRTIFYEAPTVSPADETQRKP